MATVIVFRPGDLSVKPLNVKKSSALPLDLHGFTPIDKGTYPVLQFHHGFLCQCISYSQLLQHIASHGFIVVAPQESLVEQTIESDTKQIQDLAAVTNWLATGLQPELPNGVYADFTKFGLSGHSKGGKAAFCLALGAEGITLNLKVSALIGIDPVAGRESICDPLTGHTTLTRTEPHILTYIPRAFNLAIPTGVIGTGLGSEKENILTPPCAPNGLNHAEFFNECKPPCCYFLAKDYGHMDMLDDDAPSKLERCVCKSGTGPKELMRRGIGDIVVAFMKAYLQGKNSDLLGIVKNPKIAPILLDPLIYVPA